MTVPAATDRLLADARLALAQGDFARAARIAEQAGRAEPLAADAYFVMAMALAETGHAAHALGRVQRAVELDLDNAEYLAQPARLLILLHCGLAWDPACLEFHTVSGAIATSSAQQVRRPINRDSVGR